MTIRIVIASTDPRGNRFFYAGRGRWSDEYPDAIKYRTSTLAKDRLKLGKAHHPDNLTWQAAQVERVTT